jgi:hypothetical protein
MQLPNIRQIDLTPFEKEVLASVLWQIHGFRLGKVSERVTRRILRATLRRIKPNNIGRSLNSIEATNVEEDHAVPVNTVVDFLLAEPTLDEAKLIEILSRYLVSVTITKQEHNEHLKRIGLQSAMPEDWDRADVYVRYKLADIAIHES